jgi:hypothetical protein
MRLSRVRTQLSELRAIERKYLAKRPITVSLSYDAQRKLYVHTATARVAPPPMTSLLVGELAHNLRAALDNMVTSAAVANVGVPLPVPKRPAMPVCLNTPAWEKALTHQLVDLSRDAQAAIRSLQPLTILEKTDAQWYEKPDRHPLHLLNELWNRDKHHTPRVAVLTLRRGKFDFDRKAVVMYLYWAGVARKKVIGRHKSASGLPLKDRSRFLYRLGFAEWPFRNGDLLVAQMADMVKFVCEDAWPKLRPFVPRRSR